MKRSAARVRVAILWHDTILEEALPPPGAAITIGPHLKNTLVIPELMGIGATHTLLSYDPSEGYTLHPPPQLSTQATPLKLNPRGVLDLGALAILFQLMEAPTPVPRRPPWARMERGVLLGLLIAAMAHLGLLSMAFAAWEVKPRPRFVELADNSNCPFTSEQLEFDEDREIRGAIMCGICLCRTRFNAKGASLSSESKPPRGAGGVGLARFSDARIDFRDGFNRLILDAHGIYKARNKLYKLNKKQRRLRQTNWNDSHSRVEKSRHKRKFWFVKIKREISVHGHCKLESVFSLISSKLRGFKYCQLRYANNGAYLDVSGEIKISFTINQNGNVSKIINESSTVRNPKVGGCVKRQISRLRFPRPKDGVCRVRLPLIFNAR